MYLMSLNVKWKLWAQMILPEIGLFPVSFTEHHAWPGGWLLVAMGHVVSE